ncbi:YCF48-related protein [bacterium]|nr:YCF48-related protein [bacterium]
MRWRYLTLWLMAAMLLYVVLMGCGGNGDDGPNSPSNGSVQIEPKSARAVIGQEVSFEFTVASEAKWTVSNPQVASFVRFSGNGDAAVFVCNRAGRATVTMDWNGKIDRAELEVIGSGTWDLVARTELSSYGQYSTTDVQFLDATYGWIVGLSTNGAIGLVTQNGGRTWQEKFPRHQLAMYAVSSINRNVGWIGGDRLFRTTDGGQTWQFTHNSASQSLAFLNQNTGFIVGRDRKLYKTTTAGLQWTLVGNVSGFVDEVFFLDNSYGWVAGDFVYRTTDGGQTWNVGTPNIGSGDQSNIIYDLNFRNRAHGWVVIGPLSGTSTGLLYRSNDGGATFDRRAFQAALGERLRSVYLHADLSGWAVTSQGSFFQSADEGNTSVRHGARTNQPLSKVNFIGNFGYAYGETGNSGASIGLFIFRPSN